MRFAGLFLVAVSAWCTPTYQVTNLGGFGGGVNVAYALNAAGQTAGFAVTSGGTNVAFSAVSGAVLLDAPATADDINATGSVVGTSFASGSPRATVWSGGVAETVLAQDSMG